MKTLRAVGKSESLNRVWVSITIVLAIIAVFYAAPAIAGQADDLANRITVVEEQVERLAALEHRVDELCRQLDRLNAKIDMTSALVVETAEANERYADEGTKNWNEYYQEQARECH